MAPNFVKTLFLYGAGHTYSNLSRLFLRLFAGIIFMQFGIRQLGCFSDLLASFHGVLGMSGETTLIIVIAIEIICSILIILGLFTRLAVILPIISMCFAEKVIMDFFNSDSLERVFSMQAGYLPIMFIGIFIFMLLAGPGKISLDYMISLHLLSESNDHASEKTLDNA